jgi:glycosyltransferase involved in cell wall biosynthesis
MHPKVALLTGMDIRSYGGGERLAIEIAKYFKSRFPELDIQIFSIGTRVNVKRVKKETIEQELNGVKVHFYELLNIPLTRLVFLLDPRLIILFFRLRKFNVIYSFNSNIIPFLYLLSKLLRLRTISGIHSPVIRVMYDFKGQMKKRGKYNRFLLYLRYIYIKILKYFLLRSKEIHVLNSMDKVLLEKMGYKGKIFLVPNFSFIEKPIINNNKEKFICLLVARLDDMYVKGLDLAIDIINRVLSINSNILFYIIGSGKYQYLFKEMEKKYPNTIKVLGFIHGHTLIKIYGDASLLMLTSRLETFPLVTMEALSSGLPVLAFKNTGGPDDIIENESIGTLIEPYNTENFAREIVRYYNIWSKDTFKYYQDKLERSKRILEKYGREYVLSQYLNMIILNR